MDPLIRAGLATGVQTISGAVRSDTDIADTISSFTSGSGINAIIVSPDVFVASHRATVISSVALHRVLTVYPYPYFAADGGLLSYGIDTTDIFRLAGGYA